MNNPTKKPSYRSACRFGGLTLAVLAACDTTGASRADIEGTDSGESGDTPEVAQQLEDNLGQSEDLGQVNSDQLAIDLEHSSSVPQWRAFQLFVESDWGGYSYTPRLTKDATVTSKKTAKVKIPSAYRTVYSVNIKPNCAIQFKHDQEVVYDHARRTVQYTRIFNTPKQVDHVIVKDCDDTNDAYAALRKYVDINDKAQGFKEVFFLWRDKGLPASWMRSSPHNVWLNTTATYDYANIKLGNSSGHLIEAVYGHGRDLVLPWGQDIARVSRLNMDSAPPTCTQKSYCWPERSGGTCDPDIEPEYSELSVCGAESEDSETAGAYCTRNGECINPVNGKAAASSG